MGADTDDGTATIKTATTSVASFALFTAPSSPQKIPKHIVRKFADSHLWDISELIGTLCCSRNPHPPTLPSRRPTAVVQRTGRRKIVVSVDGPKSEGPRTPGVPCPGRQENGPGRTIDNSGEFVDSRARPKFAGAT